MAFITNSHFKLNKQTFFLFSLKFTYFRREAAPSIFALKCSKHYCNISGPNHLIKKPPQKEPMKNHAMTNYGPVLKSRISSDFITGVRSLPFPSRGQICFVLGHGLTTLLLIKPRVPYAKCLSLPFFPSLVHSAINYEAFLCGTGTCG